MNERLDRALRAFDANAFATRHGGYKESNSPRSREYLLVHPACGSDRLRWRHEPGVKMAWICWGCGKSGDTLDLVSMLERVDRDGAIGYVLGDYVGGDAPTELRDVAVVRAPTRPMLERLPQIPYPHGFELIDPRVPPHFEAVEYLVGKRGLTYQDLAFYRIGYSRVGRLARDVVFPCFMDGGATWDPPANVTKDQRKAWVKATKYRKTLNPYVDREDDTGAAEILFNYDHARVSEHVVIVEGPIDAIKVGSHAVALLGKADSPMKVERLLRMNARRYTVYLDPGEKELAAAMNLAAQLSAFAPTFIATPPPGNDPGSLTPAQNAVVIARGTPFKQAGLVSKLWVR